MMCKESFQKMLAMVTENEIRIIVSAISGCGGYSSDQMIVRANCNAIQLEDDFIILIGINERIGVTDSHFERLYIPYERIVGIGIAAK